MYRNYITKGQFEALKQEQLRYRYMDDRRVRELFPGIEEIVISYHLYHNSVLDNQIDDEEWVVKPENMAVFVVDCCNRECTSSGYDLMNVIFSMVREHQTENSGEMHCKGQEAPDHPEQSCNGILKYTIRISYNYTV